MKYIGIVELQESETETYIAIHSGDTIEEVICCFDIYKQPWIKVASLEDITEYLRTASASSVDLEIDLLAMCSVMQKYIPTVYENIKSGIAERPIHGVIYDEKEE